MQRLSMNPNEKKRMLEHLDAFRASVDAIVTQTPCVQCSHYIHIEQWCAWHHVPVPEDKRANGCKQWEDSEIPF